MLCTNGGKFDYLKKLENSLADPQGAGWTLDINVVFVTCCLLSVRLVFVGLAGRFPTTLILRHYI